MLSWFRAFRCNRKGRRFESVSVHTTIQAVLANEDGFFMLRRRFVMLFLHYLLRAGAFGRGFREWMTSPVAVCRNRYAK